LRKTPSGFVSIALSKFCEIDSVEVVGEVYHLRSAPWAAASLVAPHMTVIQYGSVLFAMTPARVIALLEPPVPPVPPAPELHAVRAAMAKIDAAAVVSFDRVRQALIS
jgi:hypothetical protein